ncbi:MAG TPA: SusC/RagA family TonB-linked outer membrane protein [Chitinophagaceae bacterium]|nr:SusC/RagA family TonB-linked outer membrane protein [Chitinophagaceae bacterium]
MRKIVSLLLVLLLSVSIAIAQTRTVTGIITDVNGAPMGFATVTVKGTKVATAADPNGKFSIKAKTGDVLVVTSANADPKEVTVGADNNITVQLTLKTTELSTVVVTSLGIKREAKSLGYSVATVNSDQLNISKPINVAQGLIGQVSGAQISIINNGVDPQIRLQLRGERHINYDNQALLVVDGMLVRNDFLASINPEDIDNISVLKGASASALYGSEATNGVVIVTTKRGSKNGKPRITVGQTVTAEEMAYFPSLQTTYSGYGGELGTFFAGTPYAFNSTDPYTGFTNYIPFENQQYGAPFDGDPNKGYIGSPNENGEVFKVPFKAQPEDPRRAFFVTGWTTQSDASISSGDAQNSNFVGLQYANVKGTMPKDMAQRANVRFAGKRTYGIFSIDYTINYSHKLTNTVGNDFNGTPVYWNLLNTPANIPITMLKDWYNPTSWANANYYYNAYYANPYWAIDNSRVINKIDNLQGAFTASVKATPWLSINYTLGALFTTTVYKQTLNGVQFNDFESSDPWGEGNYQSGGNKPGSVSDQSVYQKRIEQNISLSFQHKFGAFDTRLIVGNDIWDRYSNQQYDNNSNLYIPGLFNVAYGSNITLGNVSQGISESRLIGGYADLSVDYKDFLFLHANYRRDYSSLLAPGNNSYDVYGVDGAFAFTDVIKSLKNSSWLSFGKVRVAYSKTGQITANPYSTVNTFGLSGGFPYGSLASLSLSGTYNNPSLVPEKTIENEVGIELGLLKNHLNVNATYYTDDNSEQIFPVNITTATGYSSAYVNAAETKSHGWEFDVKWNRIVNTKTGLRWDMAANFAIQETKVIGLLGGVKDFNIGNSNHAIVGMTFPQMYVSDLNRDPQGHVIVDATTGLPSLSGNLIAAGNTTPKYILGLTSTLTYKELTLQVIADYKGGYVFYNNAEQNLDFTGASAHTATNGRQNFIYPNSVIEDANGKFTPNTSVYTQDGNIGFWVYSPYRKAGTSYVENAAAWKIRTISLTYDFTHLFKQYKFVQGVKLTAMCNNVFMFRPKENDFTDPEFNYNNANGYGYNTYYQLPPTRQFTGVLTLNF